MSVYHSSRTAFNVKYLASTTKVVLLIAVNGRMRETLSNIPVGMVALCIPFGSRNAIFILKMSMKSYSLIAIDNP